MVSSNPSIIENPDQAIPDNPEVEPEVDPALNVDPEVGPSNIEDSQAKITVDLPYRSPEFYREFQAYPSVIMLAKNANKELDQTSPSLPLYEPSTYKQAISCPDKEKWLLAMKAEVDELISQNCWTLSPINNSEKDAKKPNLTSGFTSKKPYIGGRWVFKIKTNINN